MLFRPLILVSPLRLRRLVAKCVDRLICKMKRVMITRAFVQASIGSEVQLSKKGGVQVDLQDKAFVDCQVIPFIFSFTT